MLKNLASVAISDALNRGFFFLFSVVVARTIEPHEFGIYGLAISLGVWLWAVADAGLGGHGLRLLAQGADMGETVSAVLIARLPVLFTLGVALGVILTLLPIPIHEKIIYATAFIYVLGMALFPAWIARAHHANREYLLAYAAVSLLGLLCLGFFLLGIFEKNGVTASLARTLPWLTGSVIALWLIERRMRFSLRWAPQKGLLRESAPLGLAAIIYKLIPLVPYLGVRLIGGDLGAYAAMMQLQTIMLAGAEVFSSVFLPTITKALTNGDPMVIAKAMRRHFSLLITLSLGMFIVYSGYGESILGLIYGHRYTFNRAMLLCFASAFLFASIRSSIDSILIARGQYTQMARNGAMAVALPMPLMIGFGGAIPATVSYALSELLLLAFNRRSMVQSRPLELFSPAGMHTRPANMAFAGQVVGDRYKRTQ